MKRGGRNAGFTLAETMIVFALIAILGGLAYINVIEQKKNLNFMEYNETAKEIFLAAQEHLSAAYAKRELHDFNKNVGVYEPLNVDMEKHGDADFGVPISGNLYALYIEGGELSTASGGKLAYDTMLPYGSIVPGQNFAILYDRDTYRVLDVFYTGAEYKFSSWDYVKWQEHFKKLTKDYLKNFPAGDGHTIIMGYYGQVNVSGASVASGGSLPNPSPEDPASTTPPSNGINPGLMIVNGPVLYALVTLDSNYKYDNGGGIKLELTQKSPAPGILNTVVQLDVFQKGKDITANEGDSQKLYLVVLDDVTTISGSFTQIASGITPGANIEAVVKADGYISDPSIMLHGESNTVTCNSLFADNSEPDKPKVHIQNFRHLQNLANSGLGANLTGILDQSLGWSEFKTNISTYRSTYFSGTIYSDEISYQTINPTNSLTLRSKGIADGDSKDRIYKIRGLELPGNGNSGLFGTLKDNTTIERIEMEGTSVEGTPTNAGALIGKVTAGEVTVNKVASYGNPYPKTWPQTDRDDDGEATTITASGSAGGLVGAITGGTVTIEKCAAAHLVTATGGNAGGLVGSVASGATLTIQSSYTGSYKIDPNSGKYKKTGGSLDADVTASGTGGYAGGLVGKAADGTLTLKKVYSVASASGGAGAGSLVGSAFTTPNDSYGRGEYQIGAGTVKKDAKILYSGTPKTKGRPYHAALFLPKFASGDFPYRTIGGAVDDPAWWLNIHMGDWPVRDKLEATMWGASGEPVDADAVNTVNKTIANDNVRYAWISLKDVDTAGNFITLAVSNVNGDNDTKSVLYAFKKQADNSWKAEQQGVATSTVVSGVTTWTTTWSNITSSDPKPEINEISTNLGVDVGELSANESVSWLRVTLDDITTDKQRFKDLFPQLDSGQEIRIRAGVDINHLDFANLLDDSTSVRFDGSKGPDTGYVLYDIRTPNNNKNAVITNVRHLQNLDTSVSGVGDTFTKAELLTDLDETEETWPGGSTWTDKSIQVGESAAAKTAKSFYGIDNANLTEFNGNNKTLQNFTIDRTLGDDNGLAKDAGLFRALSPMAESEAANKATVYGLTLENFTVKAGTDGNAGALAASMTGRGTVQNVQVQNCTVTASGTGAAAGLISSAQNATVENVTLMSPTITANGTGKAAGLVSVASGTRIENVLIKEPSVAAGGNAGGLVADASGTVTVRTVLVWSKTKSVTSSGSGAAGGLVGANGGTLTIDNSAATMYVSATNGAAGGLIGLIADNKSATVTNSYAGGHTVGGKYAAADWNVKSTSGAAGGLVGQVGNYSTLSGGQSFSAASVKGGTAAGGVIGTASGTVTFTNSVYAAGPVSNVSKQKVTWTNPTLKLEEDGDATNAGAFLGTGSAVSLTNAFYLPQIYSDGELLQFKTSNIAYLGVSDNQVFYNGAAESLGFSAASYGDATSPIAGKKNSNSNLEYKTFHCDNDDKIQGTEYPFAVWTKFTFDQDKPDNTKPNSYYYGDFEVVQNTSTINVKVYFKYQLEGGSADFLKNLEGENIYREVPYTKYEGLSVLPPSLPHVNGYEFDYWQLSTGSGGTGNVQFTSGAYDPLEITRNQIVKALGNEPKADKKNEAGTITEDNSATREITVTAVYKSSDSNRTVQYMRPIEPDDLSQGYESLMTETATKKDDAGHDTTKKWGDLKPLKPFLSGYDFDGYYLDPENQGRNPVNKGTRVFKIDESDNRHLTAVNATESIESSLPDGEPLKLYMRFTKIEYYTVNVYYKYKTESGAYDGEYATRSYRFKVGDNDPNELKSVPLYDTEAALDTIYRDYRDERPKTDLKAEHISGNTFNLADTLENDDKAANATTNYYVCYNAEPVTTQHYRVQYRLMHTEKSDNAVARPLPDYIQYATKQDVDADGKPKVDAEENPVMVNDYDKRPLEIAAPKDAKYNSGENSKYEYFPAFDDDGKIQLGEYTPTNGHTYTETTQVVAGESAAKTFTQSHIPDPESMQGFTLYAVSYGGIDATHDGTSAKPFLITYTYERDKYFLTFNTSGGTNFPQFERYFGQLVNDASQMMDRVKVEFNSGTGVVKLLKQNGAETTNPVEAGTETVTQTIGNVIPYRQGYRLPTATQEQEPNAEGKIRAFWEWRATASSSRDATEGNRVNVFMTNYEGLTMPATDMTAKAYYRPTETTYKIVLLKQRVDDDKNAANKDKSYTQYDEITVTALTESTPVPIGNNGTDYRTKAPKNFHYRGDYAITTQRTIEANDGSTTSVDSVMGDGSTVVNVFFDLDSRTLEFKSKVQFTQNNSGMYAPFTFPDGQTIYAPLTYGHYWTKKNKYTPYTSPPSNNMQKYGIVDGKFVKVTYSKSWYDSNWNLRYYSWYYTVNTSNYLYNGVVYNQENANGKYTGQRYELMGTSPDITTTETQSDSNARTQVQIDGTTFYVLERKDDTSVVYDSDGNRYTDTRYAVDTHNANKYTTLVTMTGLYGQTLAKYGYVWPAAYYWREGQNSGDGMTFLDQFGNPSGMTSNGVRTYYSDAKASGDYHYYHYKQDIPPNSDAEKTYTLANTAVKSESENFNFTDKYEPGFKVSSYSDESSSGTADKTQNPYSLYKDAHIYHERQKFKLKVKVDGVVPDGVPEAGIDVYYDQPLYQIDWLQTLTNQLASPSALANEAEGTVYKYWCPDPDCDQHTLAWNKDLTDDEGNVIQSITTMPANDMTIYAKKIPPTYYVRFQLDDPDENQKPSSPAYEDGATGNPEPVGTLKDGNIDSKVTSNSGGLLKAYSPVSNDSNYTFDGWYTKSGVKFYSSMPITPDVASEEFTAMAPDTDALGNVKKDDDGHPVKTLQTVKGVTLYPKWKYVGTEYANVRIRCFYTTKNEEGQPVKTYIPFTYEYKNGENWVPASSGDDAKKTMTLANVGTVGQNYEVFASNVTLGDGFASYDYKPGARITNVKKNPGDTENLIELEFYDTAWKYEFEYWVRLRNLTHGTGEQWLPIQKDAGHPDGGYESNDSESFAFLVPKPGGTSTEASKDVEINKPQKIDENGQPMWDEKIDENGQPIKKPILDPHYAGYMVVGYRLASEDTDTANPGTLHTDSFALVSPGADRSKPVIIRVYLEVDPTLIQLNQDPKPYSGQGLDWNIQVNDNEAETWGIGTPEIVDNNKWREELSPPGNLTAPEAPEKVSYTAYRQYWDMSQWDTATNMPASVERPKNSGTYAETVYITAQYDGKTYLLWKSADFEGSDNTTYLTINPLAITLKSASDTKTESVLKGEPLTAETVTVIGDNQFVDTDKTKYEIMINKGGHEVVNPNFVTFAVDSFRRSVGTTANIFEVNLPDGIAQNYNITKEYGTLTVK